MECLEHMKRNGLVIDKDKKIIRYTDKIVGIVFLLVTLFIFYNSLKQFDLKKLDTYFDIFFIILFFICSIYLLTYSFYYNSSYITLGCLFFRLVIDLKSVTAITSYQLGLTLITYHGKDCAVLLPRKTSRDMKDFLQLIKTEFPYIIVNL